MILGLTWRVWATAGVGLLVGCTPFTNQFAPADSQIPEQAFHDGKLDDQHAAELCLKTANGLSREGHFQKAAVLYEKSRHLDPKLKVSRPLAASYAQLGMFDQAEREFQKAVEEAPGDADLLNDFGCLYLRTNKLPEAAGMLQRAIQADARHPRASMNLAECYVRSGQIQQGIQLFSSQVGPAAALSNTGILLASMGRTDESKDFLKRALVQDPNLSAAKAFLARLEHNNGDVTPAAAK